MIREFQEETLTLQSARREATRILRDREDPTYPIWRDGTPPDISSTLVSISMTSDLKHMWFSRERPDMNTWQPLTNMTK